MPAWHGLSSWGCPAVSASRWPSGYRHAAAVAADSRAVAVCRWPCVWTPVCPDRSVDSRRILALIVRHSLHGQPSTMERVGQRPLQGLHLAVTAFLCCVDDTRLQVQLTPFVLNNHSNTFKSHCAFPFCGLQRLSDVVRVIGISRRLVDQPQRPGWGLRMLPGPGACDY